MDNQQALKLTLEVLSSPETQLWELCRIAELNIDIDLIGLPFRKANIANQRLIDFNFSECDLSYANMEGSELSRAKFRNANLSCACLVMADLREVDMHRTNLSSADLRQANLQGADLTESNLSNTNLINANMRGSILRGVDFRHARLTDFGAIRVNSGETERNIEHEKRWYDFRSRPSYDAKESMEDRIEIRRLHLHAKSKYTGRGIKLLSADLSGAIMSNIDLSFADLTCSKLTGADLSCAELQYATLEGADLRKANLSGAQLDGAILMEAKLDGVILNGANLAGAVINSFYGKSLKEQPVNLDEVTWVDDPNKDIFVDFE